MSSADKVSAITGSSANKTSQLVGTPVQKADTRYMPGTCLGLALRHDTKRYGVSPEPGPPFWRPGAALVHHFGTLGPPLDGLRRPC